MSYDSTLDTLRHTKRVSELLNNSAIELLKRANVHDNSKLSPAEKQHFDRETPLLKGLTYGTKEYKESLIRLGVALKHHYENNSHHPEHYNIYKCRNCEEKFYLKDTWIENGTESKYRFHNCMQSPIYELAIMDDDIVEHGINGMNLFDLLEMFFDWKAAGERHEDGNIFKSIDHNKNRFMMSEQLVSIFENTAHFLNYEKPKAEKLVFKKGDKVHYQPEHYRPEDKFENGIVKGPTPSGGGYFVVYNCGGDWDDYENYTAANTPEEYLFKGWRKNTQ